MKLVWFPTWRCQNYNAGRSHSEKCPYCPYGYKNNRLLYEDQEASPDGVVNWEKVALFLIANKQLLNGFVEISGGEPLLCNYLPEVLTHTKFNWAITSNSLRTSMVQRLAEEGSVDRCLCWSASYHPLSGKDDAFAEAIEVLYIYGVHVNSTVVVAAQTIGVLEKTLKFLQRLPIHRINYHMDAHSGLSEQEKKEAHKIVGDFDKITGPAPKNVLCNKHGALLALGPDCNLYPCVSYCYRGENAMGDCILYTNLRTLRERIEQCSDECFACCDWVKHR